MKKNTLTVLTVLIAILATVSVFLSFNSDSNRSEDQSTGEVLIPGLYDQLNDVTSIEIVNNFGKTVIEKSDNSRDIWLVKSKDNYPGDITQIRKTLIELSELKKIEAKTRKEKNYSKLGVQNISDGTEITGSQSSHITIYVKGNKLDSVIIGNKKSGHRPNSDGIKSLNYARLEKEKQVWLVAGNLNLPVPKKYMNTEITNIPEARIQKVKITHTKGSRLTISRKDKTDSEFTLKQLKKNKELKNSGILKSVAAALANLNFDDVLKKDNTRKFDNPVKIEYLTFNGLAISFNVAQADNKFYFWLENAKSTKPILASLKQEDVENKNNAPGATKEATDINNKHSQWIYIIPSYKAELLTGKLKDLVKAKEKK